VPGAPAAARPPAHQRRGRRQAKTPHALPRLFEHALVLQEGRDAGSLAAATLAAEVAVLEAAVDRLVAGERTHLFTFLRVPGVPATNWRAEQAHPPTWPSPAPIGIRRPPRAQTLWKRWIMPASGPRP